ncbi:hypothetical protein [uncultured Bacteroides sp.]|uniref:hypothetical protein n=1 Tax=uncultured Bacteroides sp. TaxID=162156 RepID=UPI00266F4152|nr:hypothetical protein [uncultured Bacteroides sp.]
MNFDFVGTIKQGCTAPTTVHSCAQNSSPTLHNNESTGCKSPPNHSYQWGKPRFFGYILFPHNFLCVSVYRL